MTTARFLLFLLTALSCLIAACSTPAALDAGAADATLDGATPSDTSSTDGGPELDAPTALDAGPSGDAGLATDTGARDAGSADDAAMATDAGCEYLDLDIWIVRCAAMDLYARRFTVPSGATAACPDYFTLGAVRFDTLADALGSQSCAPDCLRAAGTSVSLLRCGRRTGYIVYRDADMSCPDVYETPDGLFGSTAEWDAAFPCP